MRSYQRRDEVEDLFDFITTDDTKPIEKMAILEERIAKIVRAVKELKDKNRLLQERVRELEEELLRKKEELDRIKQRTEEIEMAQVELDNLTHERGLIRARIEGILRELEGVELN